MAFTGPVPKFLRRLKEACEYGSNIPDQHFGTGLYDSDLCRPVHSFGFVLRPRTQASANLSGQCRMKNEKDKFQVILNVWHFEPDEIDVKVVDNFIVVHGKHEEKIDEHGFIEREFTRRYLLPEDAEPVAVKSTLSANGVLTIEAPKKAVDAAPLNERVVPITLTKRAADKK